MTETLTFLVVLAVVGTLVWQFRMTKEARTTTRVESRHPPQEAAEIISSVFGGAQSVIWTNASGPGAINKRRRGKDGGITMSIDIEQLANGGSGVDMWASNCNEYFIFWVNFAGSLNSRKKAIARILTS